METTQIPINIALIDSLSLKIPLLKCEIIDTRLTSKTATYYHDLKAYDDCENPPKPIVIEYNGITVRIHLIICQDWDKELAQYNTVEYICLTVSSKLLKHDYFKGITKKTVSQLYEEFLSYEIFYCDFETFINAKVSDVDICLNRYIDTPLLFSDMLDSLYHQCGYKKKHIYKVNQVENIGMAFNERRKAKPSLPFIKFYHKYFELQTKSAEFYNTYLHPHFYHAIVNLTRVEVTIRNYAHRQRLTKYGIIPDYSTLKELLDISHKDLFKVITFSLESYIEKKIRVKSPNLSPLEHIIFELMQNCYNTGYDLKSLLPIADLFKGNNNASTVVSRSRIRSKLKEMDDYLLKSNPEHEFIKKVSKNSKINEYLAIFNLTGITPKADL
jgi:hypothetical protein